jgi:predicted DNA-binding transcriptional regulator AlpA
LEIPAMTDFLLAPLVPVPAGPALDADPADDPRLASVARAFAAAVVSALSPWLARLEAAFGRETPVLLSADEARAYCGGLAKSTWSDFDQRGVIPAAVRVGGRVFWRRADLDAWVDRSCPGRARFEEGQATAKQSSIRQGQNRKTT